MNNQICYICTLFLLIIVVPYAFADAGTPINIVILDPLSQVTLESTRSIDSINEENIISAIQDVFDFRYEDMESLVTISYTSDSFLEKSYSIAVSSDCQTLITSRHSFIVYSTDIDTIFHEIITHERLSKDSLSKSLILLATEPENWIINAVTENAETKVQMMYCDERFTEFISSSDQDEIMSKLMPITGLKESTISSIWNYENKDLGNAIDFQTNADLIVQSKEILAHAEENQERLESTVETITTGKGDIELSVGQGGCLIATATYGSELAPQVQQLREIRDNSLLNTESGIRFMNSFNDVYYSFSPIVADYERENPTFREMVKIVITPMISSLSILNYVDMDSESSVLGYGISLILLNIGMYFGIPIVVIIGIRKKI